MQIVFVCSNRLVIIGYTTTALYVTGYLTELQVGYLHVESSQVRFNRMYPLCVPYLRLCLTWRIAGGINLAMRLKQRCRNTILGWFVIMGNLKNPNRESDTKNAS